MVKKVVCLLLIVVLSSVVLVGCGSSGWAVIDYGAPGTCRGSSHNWLTTPHSPGVYHRMCIRCSRSEVRQ